MSEEEEVDVTFEEMCAGHCLTLHAKYVEDVTEELDFTQHEDPKLHNFKHTFYKQRYRILGVLRKQREIEIPETIDVCSSEWDSDLNYYMDEHSSEMFFSESPIVAAYAQRKKPEGECILFLHVYAEQDSFDFKNPQIDYYSYAIRGSVESAEFLAEAKELIAASEDGSQSYNTYVRSWV